MSYGSGSTSFGGIESRSKSRAARRPTARRGMRRTTIAEPVAMATKSDRPAPAATPSAAAIQIDAAVVRPLTMPFDVVMTPAPRKPTPVAAAAATRAAELAQIAEIDAQIAAEVEGQGEGSERAVVLCRPVSGAPVMAVRATNVRPRVPEPHAEPFTRTRTRTRTR